MTEDAFISAVLKLSAECTGGIDERLSDISSESSDEEEEEEAAVKTTGRPCEAVQGRGDRDAVGIRCVTRYKLSLCPK